MTVSSKAAISELVGMAHQRRVGGEPRKSARKEYFAQYYCTTMGENDGAHSVSTDKIMTVPNKQTVREQQYT